MSASLASGAGKTAVRPIGQGGKPDSPLLFLHCAISLAGNQWLGDETFRLLSFEGQESVSEPFDYQLQLRGNTSPRHGRTLDFDALIGRPVTVGINDPGVRDAPDAAARFAQALRQGSAPDLTLYNGLVSSFAMDEPGVYRLGMKPALWKLTLTNRYCVHAQMSIREVIAKLMRLHYVDCSLEAVSGSDNLALARVQDWLQAGESDYEFLRRLMGKAHIYYYFSHSGRGHTVVFANRPSYLQAFGGRPLRYTHSTADELGLAQNDLVFQYSYQQSLTSTGVNGAFAHQESASQQDPVPTYQTFAAFTPADPGELPFNQYRTYQYGMSSAEAQQYLKGTAASLAGSAQQLSGSSTCSGFRVGHQFTLSGEMAPGTHPAPVRPSLEGKRFVLAKVQHKASADGGYSNTFEATDAAAMLTAFSVQDTQQGTILATVVDVEGKRPNDWRYYEPANFDPESSRLRDTQAAPQDLMAKGVYVQFSSPGSGSEPVWVKLAAHMQTVPEIGVMVLVARASDESELPEVQSIVQANGSLVVTPSGWTSNTHVGSSYSTSYGDGQSIRFGRTSAYDLDKAVGIVNGQYESGQYRDTSYAQGASYSYATSENGAAGLLSRSESYGSTYSIQEAAQVQSRSTIGDTRSEETVTGTTTRVSTQNLVQNTSTTNVQSSVSTTGVNAVVDTTGMVTSLSSTGISVGASITGAASQTSLTGTREDLALTGASTSLALTGISQSVAATGSSESVSVTGSASQTSVTGSSESVSVTGAATQTSVTGASVDTGVVGTSTRTNVVDSSTSVSVTGEIVDVSVTGRETRVGMHGTSMSVDLTGAGVSLAVGLRYSLDIGGVSENIPLIYIFV
jgi:type VI secretion system secreted protein VgrG